MIEIPLTKGQVALIDDEDFELVSQYSWHTNTNPSGNCYARGCKGKNRKQILMHRLILRVSQNQFIDHINGDGLDNRKENLRITTHTQNNMNKHKSWGFSKYKGVYWNKKENKWIAHLKKNSKRIFLKRFNSEIDAALAYDAKARELFGEFARPNFSERSRP